MKSYVFAIIVMVAVLTGSSNILHAACANPVANSGEQMYNADHSIMQYCDGADWVGMGGGGSDVLSNLSCSSGEVAQYDGTSWVCGANSGGGGGDPLLLTCTNENSDGDGTDDIAACVEATTNVGIGTENYRAAWCDFSAAGQASALNRWTGTQWQFFTTSWFPCVDGTVKVWDLNAIGSGGAGGSGVLANLSCSSGEVAQYDGTNWVCGTNSGGGGSGVVESSPMTIAGGVVSWAHGLGTTPTNFGVDLLVTSSITSGARTYNVGERIKQQGYFTANRAVTVTADDTNIYITSNGAFILSSTVGSHAGNATSANSQYIFWAGGSGGSGGSGGGGGSSLTLCTNENSDGDGIDDITACVEATDVTNDVHRFHSCTSGASPFTFGGGLAQWTGTSWSVYGSSIYHTCNDGSVFVSSLGGGGSGGSGDNLGDHTATEGVVFHSVTGAAIPTK